MSIGDDERKLLEQALNYGWPEIQRHLIEEAAKAQSQEGDPYEPYWTTESDGTRTLHASPDSWWLKELRREDVIIQLPGVAIMNSAEWTVDSIVSTLIEGYGSFGEPDDDLFTEEHILAHIERFPWGQFMAIRLGGMGAGHAVGMAATMRTSRPPTEAVLPWPEAIGDMRLGAHESDGDWLYGVEMAVRPMYRRHGIGTALYAARFALARHLNLRGWYAVGMLMGYKDHAGKMDVTEYGEKVVAGALKDPTVTMQMNRGFRAERVVTEYVDEPDAGNAGVLIVWENPEYEA